MLGKKSRPVIGIISGTLISGNKSGLAGGAAASPRSPKGLKSLDFGVVGLGIVAALEKSGDARNVIPANAALFSRNLSRSIPIPVRKPRNGECLDERESLELEEYTIVTCRIPNKSCTKVYCDGRRGDDRTPFRIPKKRASVFHISPARSGEASGPPDTDFLSSCHLCHKKLQGEDIYMYRGEKAFCSTECRYKHIAMDERKEKCRSEASRTPVDVLSTSPVANSPIFTAGILAI